MGMTLEKLEKKLADIEKQREENNRIIAESKEKIDSIMAKAEEAAADGREDEYIQHKKEAEKYETTIYVKNSHNAKLDTLITKEDATSAWEHYKPNAVKAYEDSLKAFKDAQKMFFDSFMDLIKTQDKIYKVRERLYTIYTHEPYKNVVGENEQVFKDMNMAFDCEDREKTGSPEQRYFKQIGMITLAENMDISRVIYMHTQSLNL